MRKNYFILEKKSKKEINEMIDQVKENKKVKRDRINEHKINAEKILEVRM